MHWPALPRRRIRRCHKGEAFTAGEISQPPLVSRRRKQEAEEKKKRCDLVALT